MQNLPKNAKIPALVSIKDASKILGVSTKTLRRWEKSGYLSPIRTQGGHRRYSLSRLKAFKKPKIKSPVSSMSEVVVKKQIVKPEKFTENEKEYVQLYKSLHFDQKRFIKRAFTVLVAVIMLTAGARLVKSFVLPIFKEPEVSFVAENIAEKTIDRNRKVLAETTTFQDLRFAVNVPTVLRDDVSIEGGLNLIGNTILSSDDILIDPGGGGVNIGGATPANVDLEGDDLYVSGDIEAGGTIYGVDGDFSGDLAIAGDETIGGDLSVTGATTLGTATISTLTINSESITDLTGSGITISGGALTASLGTSIDSSEIEDGTITEADLNVSNSPTNGYLLSYNSSTSGFAWVDSSGFNLWTDGGTITYLTSTTDDLAIGGTSSAAPFYFDASAGALTITGSVTVPTLSSSGNLELDSTAGSLVFTGFNCSTYNNAGKLTVDASGIVMCADDETGGAASPWDVTSGVVHLISSGNNVTVGSTTNLAKLAVEGDTDEIQFLIRGNSTQTVNPELLVVENSSGTDLFVINNSGNLTLLGDATITGGDLITTAPTASLFNTGATTVNIAGNATTVSVGSGSGTTTINNALTSTGAFSALGTATITGTLTANGIVNLGDGGDAIAISGTTIGITSNSGADITLTSADDIIFDDLQLSGPIQLTDTETALPNSHTGIVDAIVDAYNTAVGATNSGWTDDGSTVRLQTAGDEVVIGGATPLSSAKFSIDGDSDQIQLIVQGDTGQSSNLAVFEQSDGTDVLTIDYNGNLTIAGQLASTGSTLTINDAVSVSGAINVTGTISNSGGNLVLDDTVDIGSATTGIRITTAGAISDIDGNLVLSDDTDINGNLDVNGTLTSGTSDEFQVDATGNITSAGTTGLTLSGAGADLVFSGTGTHSVSASSGTLQLGAVTLGGGVSGNSQNITGLGQLTVDNLRLDGNTLDTTSGNLTLDSAGGTVSVNDNLSVSGSINGLTVSAGTISVGVWNATEIGAIYGGTGQTAVAAGDLLYGSGVNTWSRRTVGSEGEVLTVSGGLPVWSTVAGASCPTCVLTNPTNNQIIQNPAGVRFGVDSVSTPSTLSNLSAGALDVDVSSVTANNVGFSLDYTSSSGVSSGDDLYAARITVNQNDADGDLFGLVITNANVTSSGTTDDLLLLYNADTSSADGGTVDNALRIASAGATITDAIDLTSSNITNAINLGSNAIVGTTPDLTFNNFTLTGSTGNISAGTYNGQTISSAASFTGTVSVATSVSSPIYTGTGAVTLQSAGGENLTLSGSSGVVVINAGSSLQVGSGSITSNDAAITIDSGSANQVNIGASDALSNGTWTISGAGAITGVTSITASGSILAATNETINGIDIDNGTVSDVVNLTINAGGDLTIGTIGLNDPGAGSATSGANLVGVFSGSLNNASSDDLQSVLEELDSAIGAGSSKWTQDTGFIYLTTTTDDFVIGGSSIAAASLYFDESDANLYLGTNESLDGVLTFYSSGVGITDASITTNASGNLLIDSTNFDVTTTGINATAIGATTASTGGFTTLSSTGATTLGNNSANVAINSDVWDITAGGVASGLTGITSSGDITFSGLTADRFVTITTGGLLTTQQFIDLTADVTGILPVANGGTGLSSTPTNGQLLIGNGTDYTLATLTQGDGMAITNLSGSITLAVDATTSGTTLVTSSNSGIEATATGIRLLGGCSSDQILKWNGSTWSCSTDEGSGTGSSKWTESGGLLFPNNYITVDLAVGGNTLAAAFSVDIEGNLVRIGTGSDADATLAMYSSGGDTGSLIYNTSDQFQFSDGDVAIDQTLVLSSAVGEGIMGGGLVDCDSSTQKLVWDASTNKFGCATDQGSGAGGSKWTAGSNSTYLTDTDSDLTVGAGDTLTAAFSIDVSANRVRIGDGADDANIPGIDFYASNAADSGSLVYTDSDQFNFTNGDVLIDQILTLGSYSLYASGSRVAQTTTFATTTASQSLYGYNLNVTNNPTTNANTGYGYYVTINDSGSLANTVYGGYFDATTANANDVAYGLAVQGDTADIFLLGGGVLSNNVAITLDSGSADSVSLGNGDALNISGNFVQTGATTFSTGTGAISINGSTTFASGTTITQQGSGQVTFGGNVDAQGGFDVTGANLTVGGANFTVAPASGNTTIGGTLGVTGLITASGGVTLPANQNLTLSSGTGTITQTYSNTTGSAATFNVTDTSASGASTVNAINVALTGTATSGTNTINALRLADVSTASNNSFTAISIGDNFTNLLQFEDSGFTGSLRGTGLSGNRVYTLPNASGEICLDSNNCTFISTFDVAAESGTNQTISTGDTLTLAAGTGIDTVASATDIVTISVQANSLDFAQFQDTLDLDANLTLNQGTNTWVQNYTGTATAQTLSLTNTGTALALTSSSTGTLLNLTSTGTGTTTTTLSIANTSSGAITTAIDVSDAEIATALAIGNNDVTVGGATISSSEFALLDGRSGTLVDSVNVGSYAVTTVTAGNGLTSGGGPGAVTLNVGAGTGIVVNADDVAIDTSVVPRKGVAETITGGWTFNTAATTFSTAINANGGITTTSGGLSLDSASGTTTVNDNLSVTGTINGLTAGSGIITGGTWNATEIGAVYGGTGQTTVAEGDLLYGSAANTWGRLTIGTDNQVLVASGGVPAWTTVTGSICPTCVVTDPTSDQIIVHPAAVRFGLDSASTASTLSSLTAGVFDINVASTTNNNVGFTLDYTSSDGVTAGNDLYAARITLTQNDADGDLFGMAITNANTTSGGTTDDLLVLSNADTNSADGGTVDNALRVVSSGGAITNAIDVSDTEIVNAISVGANDIVGTTAAINFTNFDVASTGAINVAAGVGLDTNAAGTLTLGNTTATAITLGRSGITTTNPGALTVSQALTANGTLTATGVVNLGDGGDAVAISGTTVGITSNSAGNDITLTSADDIIFDDLQLTSPIQLTATATALPNSNTGIVDAIVDAWNAATGAGGGIWTRSSELIYPTAAGDNVTIGGTSNIAKLGVVGDTDEVQLLVRGNATQTNNIFAIQTSAPANILTVSNAGNLAIEGTLSDISGTVLVIDDDLQVSGNDILDSGATPRITLGATNTITGDTLVLSGTSTFTANSLTTFNCVDCINFDDLSDSLTLDAATTITNATAGNLTINLTSSGDFVLQAGGNTRLTFNDSGNLVAVDGVLIDLSAIAHDDAASQGLKLPQGSGLTAISGGGEGYIAYDTSDQRVKFFNGTSWSDISGASTTLQEAYNNDVDGGDAVIALTGSDDSLVFRNPASSGTDSGYVLQLDQLNTGAVDGLQITQAGTGTGLSFTFSNVGTVADGILFNNPTGTLTDAIDASAANITNAINIGANAIAGTNFSVSGAGAVTGASFTDGTATLTGGALTGVTSIDTISFSATDITFAAAGTISSTTSSSITIDSGTTGAVNLGTGNNAKTINIGTGTAGNTISIGTDNTTADSINIGSALDTTIMGGLLRLTDVTSGTETAGLCIDSSNNIVTCDVSSGGTVTGSGTENFLTRWDNTGTNLVDAGLSDNGTDITLSANRNLVMSSGTGYFSQTYTGTTTDAFAITANSLTTGNLLDLTAAFSPSGGTQSAIALNLTNSPSSANTLRGLDIGFTDSGSLANTIYGLYVDATTANANDTTYAAYLAGGNVGIGDDSPASLLTVGSSDAFQVNSSGNIVNIGGAAHSISNNSGALEIDSATTGAINVGTGANAKTITIGNNTGATALNFTSGTGPQTFTSSVATGTTTSSAWVFTDNALTTGTGAYISSSSITEGKLLHLSTGSANTWTTGNLFDVTSTATSLTSGRLANFDWSPASGTATGDLVRINIGPNGSTTGNLFNITDDGSTLFRVNESIITSALPHEFTAAGDVTMAYDLSFTNQTASSIKTRAPFTIDVGESWESNDLTMRVYNAGGVIIDGSTDVNTGTSGVLDLNVNSLTANNVGLNVDYTVDDTAGTGDDLFGAKINLTQNDADADLFGLQITSEATTNAAAGSYEALLKLVNAENTAGAVTDAIFIDSTSATDADITDAIDASDTNITNAINVGQNFILGDGIRQFSSSSTVWTFEDTSGNDLMTLTNNSNVGDLVLTGDASIYGGSLTLGTDGQDGSLTIYNDAAVGGDWTVSLSPSASQTADTAYTLPIALPGSDNYVLTSTTGGVMAWQSVAGVGGVTETGTNASGQIAYFTSDSVITSSANWMFVDNQTTGDTLSLAANTLTTGNLFDLTATYVDATGGTGSAVDINLTNTPSTNPNTLRGLDIGFTDGGSLANTIYGLYVDPTTANANDTEYAAYFNGNVGIGTTEPASALHVNGNISLPNAGRIRFDNGVGAYIAENSNGLQFYTGSSGQDLAISIDGLGNTTIGGVGYFQRSGNVGVGDTSPDYLLELYDATTTPAFALSDDDVAHGLTDLAQTDVFSHLTSLSTTAGGAQWTAISDTDAQALSIRGVIGSTDPTDTTAAIKLVGAKSDGSTGIADLGAAETVFQVANNDDAAALTILGNGNIGIGDVTPASLLTVGASDAFQVNSSGEIVAIGGAAHTLTDSSGNLAINTAGTQVVITDDLEVQGGDIVGAATTNLLNAATTVNLGSTDVTRAINIGTGANADTINIGTGGTAADDINIGGLATTTIDIFGVTTLGDGGSTNYASFSATGDLTFVGSADTITKDSGSITMSTTTSGDIIVNPVGVTNTFADLPAAGGSGNLFSTVATLNAMDATGGDIVRGYFLDLTNAAHTGGSLYGIDIDSISGSSATEYAINIGSGWDNGIYSASNIALADGTLLDLSAILHDDTGIQGLKLPQSDLTTNGPSSGDGFLAFDTGDNQVKVWYNSAWNSISGASTTLQQAYNNDTDTGDTIIALTGDDDSLIFRNPNTSGTDSSFLLQLDQLATGNIIPLEINAANTLGNLIDIDWTGATSLTGAASAVNITASDITGNGQNFYGLAISDIASAGAGNEYGVYVAGTTWDYGVYSVDNIYSGGDITVAGGDITNGAGEEIDLGEETADVITFTTAGSAEMALSATSLYPTVAEGTALGGVNNEWDSLYLGDGGGAYFGLDQDWNLAYDEAGDDRLELITSNASGFYASTAMATGTGFEFAVDSLTSGTGFLIQSAPGGATTLSGALFRLNVNGNVTVTGDIFRIDDNGNELFSVDQSVITSALPHEFTAAGDVSFGYDINLTNQTAATIESNAPLTITAGEPAESNNLTLKTYNSGQLVVNAAGGSYFEVSGATVAEFNRTTSDGTIISLQQAGTEEGTISVSGTTVSYNAFTGSHYAWTDENIDRGKLVKLTGENRRLHNRPESEIVYGVAETAVPNDPTVLGAYLSVLEPERVRDENNPHLIMAVGNGELWVVDNGENVAAGDWLISSSAKGHAQKDKGEYAISYVVARAAEAVDWSRVSETGEDGRKHTKISVLFESFAKNNLSQDGLASSGDVNSRLALLESQMALLTPHEADTDSFVDLAVTDLTVLGDAVLGDVVISGTLNVGAIQIDATNNSIDAIGTLKIQEMALGNIEFMGGLISFDTNGNVMVNEITANKYNVAGASAGTATLPAEATEIFIDTTAVSENSLIFVTPKKALIYPLSVVEKEAGVGFRVGVAVSEAEDVEFDWWIVDRVAQN